MRIKLDENLPARLAAFLKDLGHKADTAPQEGLIGRSDSDVWSAAQEQGAFLITQDLDFSDVRKFKPGTHAGILILRLREPGREALIERIRNVFTNENVEAWTGSVVVVTERKTRLRRADG